MSKLLVVRFIFFSFIMSACLKFECAPKTLQPHCYLLIISANAYTTFNYFNHLDWNMITSQNNLIHSKIPFACTSVPPQVHSAYTISSYLWQFLFFNMKMAFWNKETGNLEADSKENTS